MLCETDATLRVFHERDARWRVLAALRDTSPGDIGGGAGTAADAHALEPTPPRSLVCARALLAEATAQEVWHAVIFECGAANREGNFASTTMRRTQ